MSWVSQSLSSSLGRKVIMSLTGLFLSSFLIVHAVGNLQLFKGDNGRSFNEYSYFMTHNPVIMAVSYLLYTSILVHSLMALILTRHNRSSRPVKYAYAKPEANSAWSSRNMGILGTVLLLFIVLHMRTFWYETHFGHLPMAEYDGKMYKNLYTVVEAAFSQWWYALFYVISMGALGYHLLHGFQSGWQSLGIRHKKYTPILEAIGTYGFAIVIPVLFAAMPIYFLLRHFGLLA